MKHFFGGVWGDSYKPSFATITGEKTIGKERGTQRFLASQEKYDVLNGHRKKKHPTPLGWVCSLGFSNGLVGYRECTMIGQPSVPLQKLQIRPATVHFTRRVFSWPPSGQGFFLMLGRLREIPSFPTKCNPRAGVGPPPSLYRLP